MSESYYVIVRKHGKGAVVRISSHFLKDTHTKFTGWYIGNVRDKRTFYVFSNSHAHKARNNFYPLDHLEDFFKDIEEYLELKSE